MYVDYQFITTRLAKKEKKKKLTLLGHRNAGRCPQVCFTYFVPGHEEHYSLAVDQRGILPGHAVVVVFRKRGLAIRQRALDAAREYAASGQRASLSRRGATRGTDTARAEVSDAAAAEDDEPPSPSKQRVAGGPQASHGTATLGSCKDLDEDNDEA
jgi:hypothetical protein